MVNEHWSTEEDEEENKEEEKKEDYMQTAERYVNLGQLQDTQSNRT